MIEVILVI